MRIVYLQKRKTECPVYQKVYDRVSILTEFWFHALWVYANSLQLGLSFILFCLFSRRQDESEWWRHQKVIQNPHHELFYNGWNVCLVRDNLAIDKNNQFTNVFDKNLDTPEIAKHRCNPFNCWSSSMYPFQMPNLAPCLLCLSLSLWIVNSNLTHESSVLLLALLGYFGVQQDVFDLSLARPFLKSGHCVTIQLESLQ